MSKYYKKLIGKQVYLSPLNIEDAPLYTEWLNDIGTAIYLEILPQIINLDKEKSILNEFVHKDFHNLSIITLENDQLIGTCGFIHKDHLNQVGEVGIFLCKEYWGKGYGQEALSLLLDFGFNVLNLYNIHLRCYSFNQRALQCYKNVGFKEIGRHRQAKVFGDKRYDIILMDILRSEFQSPVINPHLDQLS